MPPAIAIISQVPTPYRIHFHRRIARELPVRLHSLFTHSNAVSGPAQWRMDMPQEIGPVFFGKDALTTSTRDFGKQWRLFRRITAFLEAHDVRLVILDGYADLTRVLLLRWANRRGLPLLLRGDSNIHDDRHLSRAKKTAKKIAVGWAVRQAAGLMPMGSCGTAYFNAYGGQGKPSFICPYEPDYGRIRDLGLRSPGADGADGPDVRMPSRRSFLYCGRLVPEKRADVAVDAFASIAAAFPDWDLVVAGDGPLRAALESRVPEPLRARVKFVGFLQTDENIAVFHACDCLLLPSVREPWAVVVNEACASGLAIVCSDIVGAAAELVENGVNGFKTPPGDVRSFALAMERVAAAGPAMKRASRELLEQWRRKADPVDAVRQALAAHRIR